MNTDKHTVTLNATDYLELLNHKKMNETILDQSYLIRLLKGAGVVFKVEEGANWINGRITAKVEMGEIPTIVFDTYKP